MSEFEQQKRIRLRAELDSIKKAEPEDVLRQDARLISLFLEQVIDLTTYLSDGSFSKTIGVNYAEFKQDVVITARLLKICNALPGSCRAHCSYNPCSHLGEFQ